jgi:hypothetical protein
MSLRRSPRLTPASLAARRANALKSTGPRTENGKAQATLNALKHGRYAIRLPERLAQAGCPGGEARWHAIRDRIAQGFDTANPVQPATASEVTKYRREQKRMDQLANWVWCAHREWQEPLGRKLESLVKSETKLARLPHPSMNCPRVEIRHPWARRGLVFYAQRRRGWVRRQFAALLRERLYQGCKGPGAGPELEGGLRSRAYVLARPRYWERIRYCLDREGYYHPEWQGLYRQERRELRNAGLAVLLEPHPILASMRQQEQQRQSWTAP